MSNWQPARLFPAHTTGQLSTQQVEEYKKKIFRVRPFQPSPEALAMYRAVGCDATRFYLIHPDDVPGRGISVGACEHEILTD